MLSRVAAMSVVSLTLLALVAGCADQNQATTAPAAAKEVKAQYWYTVGPGEMTMKAVAKKVYGDEADWQEIAKANAQANPEKLTAGQKLVIPTLVKGGKSLFPMGCDRKEIY